MDIDTEKIVKAIQESQTELADPLSQILGELQSINRQLDLIRRNQEDIERAIKNR